MSQTPNLTMRPRRVLTVPDPAAPPPQVAPQPDAPPAAAPKLDDVLGGVDLTTLAVRPRVVSHGISDLRVSKSVPAQADAATAPPAAPSAADHFANLTDEQRASIRVTPRLNSAPVGAGPVADAGLDGVNAPPLPTGKTATQRIMHSNSKVKSAVRTALYGFLRAGIPGAIDARSRASSTTLPTSASGMRASWPRTSGNRLTISGWRRSKPTSRTRRRLRPRSTTKPTKRKRHETRELLTKPSAA